VVFPSTRPQRYGATGPPFNVRAPAGYRAENRALVRSHTRNDENNSPDRPSLYQVCIRYQIEDAETSDGNQNSTEKLFYISY
jgi:hypothetical protein